MKFNNDAPTPSESKCKWIQCPSSGGLEEAAERIVCIYTQLEFLSCFSLHHNEDVDMVNEQMNQGPPKLISFSNCPLEFQICENTFLKF